VGGSPQAGSTSGTSYTLAAGPYTVSETGGPSGYVMTFSGDCNSSGAVKVTAKQARTCKVTNTPPAPNTSGKTGTMTVYKIVHNNFNSTFPATPGSFMFPYTTGFRAVGGSPQAGSTGGTSYTLAAGPYTVSETGGPSGYVMTFSGDCNSS